MRDLSERQQMFEFPSDSRETGFSGPAIHQARPMSIFFPPFDRSTLCFKRLNLDLAEPIKVCLLTLG
jgi:hypothetical protein